MARAAISDLLEKVPAPLSPPGTETRETGFALLTGFLSPAVIHGSTVARHAGGGPERGTLGNGKTAAVEGGRLHLSAGSDSRGCSTDVLMTRKGASA